MQGVALVGNDALDTDPDPPVVSLVDFSTLDSVPSPMNTTGARNINGFCIGDCTLASARLYWIETQETPQPIPDFLSSADLLLNRPPTRSAKFAR